MSLENCCRSLIVSISMLSASLSFAQIGDGADSTLIGVEQPSGDLNFDRDHGPIRPFPGGGGRLDCRQYSYNPQLCEQIRGCQYSRIYSQCLPETGPSNPYPGQQCSRYYQDYQGCVQAGCLFDGRSGACYEQNGGPVQPANCSIFNYDEYQCESNGCFYDRRTNLCRDNGGVTPYPPPAQQNWICVARGSGWEEHQRGHEATGCNRWEAEQSALRDCQQYHGRCQISSCRIY